MYLKLTSRLTSKTTVASNANMLLVTPILTESPIYFSNSIKNYEFYEEKPDAIDRLHGIYCAILDTGGSEPEFITWAVFPLLVSNFFPKPSTK